jgi:hypothetical protein
MSKTTFIQEILLTIKHNIKTIDTNYHISFKPLLVLICFYRKFDVIAFVKKKKLKKKLFKPKKKKNTNKLLYESLFIDFF